MSETAKPATDKQPGKIVRHPYLKAMSKIAETMDDLEPLDREKVRAWFYREYPDPLKNGAEG